MYKFLHAADLHLDSQLRGLDRYDTAPVEAIRNATRRAVENLVALAIAEQVKFVVIAGDIYDGDWKDFNTGLFFSQQMARLREASIAVYLISGNHDAASRISRSLSLPENVVVFSTEAPQTVTDAATGAILHGQGFADQREVRNLSKHYPAADRGAFNIGILHTSATGYQGHDNYAPCTTDDMSRLGYDYWALGHIHTRHTLAEDGTRIEFPGNTQGRHIRETGPKGCLLVTVAGHDCTVEFCSLDVFRWDVLTVDASHSATVADVLDSVTGQLRQAVVRAEDRPLAVRIVLTGRTTAHTALTRKPLALEAEVRNAATAEAGTAVWVEKVRVQTLPLSMATDDFAAGPLSELRQQISCIADDDVRLIELAAELADLQRKLPPEVLHAVAPGGFTDPAWLRPLARASGDLLLARLSATP